MTSDQTRSLTVDTCECMTLSSGSGRFEEVYMRVNPRSAEEVRKLFGLTLEAAMTLHESEMCCMPLTVPASTAAAEDLDDKDSGVCVLARRLSA